MNTKYKSSDVAKALGSEVLREIGRQFCRRNLERSKARATQRNVTRVLETVNGGLNHGTKKRTSIELDPLDVVLLGRLFGR